MVNYAARHPGGSILVQLAQATASRPSKRWQTGCATALEQPGACDFVRAMLDAAPSSEPTVESRWGRPHRVHLSDPNATLIRGALWAVATGRPDWGTRTAIAVYRYGIEIHGRSGSFKVAFAALYALGELADPEALVFLSELQAKERDRGVLKQVAKALDAVAMRAGLSASELRERLVRDFGLDASGRKELPVGGVRRRASQSIAAEPPPSRGSLATANRRSPCPTAVKRDESGEAARSSSAS